MAVATLPDQRRTARGTLSREDRLCLLLARGALDPHVREEAAGLLASPLKWDHVLEQARVHEVYPLVYRSLKELGFAGVPDEFRKELASLYQINALRNELLAEELGTLLRALAAVGIPTIPLKGICLAERLYGDRGLRVCADLDLLVPSSRVAETFALLRTRGYQAPFPRWVLTEGMMRNSIETALGHADGEMRYDIELHWGLLWDPPHAKASMEVLWAEAHPDGFLGASIYALSPEWQALFLLIHAARHNWQGLKWLVDLHQLRGLGAVDWNGVAAAARRRGWEQLLCWGLSVCHVLLDTPLPSGVDLELPRPQPKLFPAPPDPLGPWSNTRLALRLGKGPIDKLRLIASRLLIPTASECALWPLPPSLAFLYYPLRPFGVAYRASRSVLQRRLRA